MRVEFSKVLWLILWQCTRLILKILFISHHRRKKLLQDKRRKNEMTTILGLIHAVCSPPFYYVNSSENENWEKNRSWICQIIWNVVIFFLLFSYKMKHFGFTNFLLTLKNLKKMGKNSWNRFTFQLHSTTPASFSRDFLIKLSFA